MAKSYLLYVQIEFQVLQFLRQHHPLLFFFFQVASKEVRQLLDHLPRLFRPAADKGADAVEAVEQEVGRQLLAKLKEFGLFGETFRVIPALAVLLFFFGAVPQYAKDRHTAYLQEYDVEADRPATAE